MCDEIIGETKAIVKNFNEKKVTCTMKDFYILVAFLLITITLLTAVTFYCYLMKQQIKKVLRSYHDISKLKEINTKNIL